MDAFGDGRFTIEQWSDDELRVTRTVGELDDLDVAQAAFRRIARKEPGKPFTLRRGAQLVAARWCDARRTRGGR